MDQRRFVAEIEKRVRQRLLIKQYERPYDHSRPFGPGNVGPYNWQIEFHNAGLEHPERMLMAANRVGKTRTGAAETAIHLTGLYPEWWQGRRFDEPVEWWCGSDTNETSRDIVQAALLGPIGQFGSGWIPADCIIGEPSKRQAGIGNVVDSIQVRHIGGGISQCGLKTYEQGEKTWQGTTKHGVWMDEEPPVKIFSEAQTRTLDTKGIILVTRTPLEGHSDVVVHFLEPRPGAKIYLKNASWNDAPHLDEAEKAQRRASYPEHEVETRTTGQPMMGSGAVFPIGDSLIAYDDLKIQAWWPRINGIDFGFDHPGAGVFCALDPEGNGAFYVYDCYKASGQTPIYHAEAMKKHGDWIPNAWPHDGLKRDPNSGEAIKNQFRGWGVYMLKEPASDPGEAGQHVEPALIETLEWMRTGRFKVHSNLTQWFEEKRLYHRKDAILVKIRDDLLSATRYAFMMRRYARTKPPEQAIGSLGPSQPIVGRNRWLRNDA